MALIMGGIGLGIRGWALFQVTRHRPEKLISVIGGLIFGFPDLSIPQLENKKGKNIENKNEKDHLKHRDEINNTLYRKP